jgi:hypothetical protein
MISLIILEGNKHTIVLVIQAGFPIAIDKKAVLLFLHIIMVGTNEIPTHTLNSLSLSPATLSYARSAATSLSTQKKTGRY